jgi:hypothetical protein
LSAHAAPAPVVIEEVGADGELLPLRGGSLVIPPGHKQFEFRFTALNFDAPDKTRFRYQLEGFDTDWVEADTRRTAHYGNLSPNHYRFHVAACNSAGVWNEKGASLEFTVQPHFYQTPRANTAANWPAWSNNTPSNAIAPASPRTSTTTWAPG